MSHDKDVEDVDVWKEKIQQDINELKTNQNNLQTDVAALKMNDKLQDREISTIKETLSGIKEDTQWIRRKITGAVITAGITAIVGGVIGIAIANIF
ncbi:hemolysin XhlA family protein [Virgibacillus sediminis]|uniref:Hemolysin XhlA family protein n=1 Tax=Virgibacillus sediminis TaxID=202260 RepID=A0ABV7A6W7_9BACI